MTHTYHISGMTCTGCENKVKALLQQVNGVKDIRINLKTGEADISMYTHVPLAALQQALKDYPKYSIIEKTSAVVPAAHTDAEDKRSWLATYKPILLIFTYITGITLLLQVLQEDFRAMQWMNHFMAGFFLVFSFFKLLDLNGFADSYATYDIVARQWRGWGYIYAFTELGLGLAYLTGFEPMLTNTLTLVVMTLSIAGVLQSVLNKRAIKCACLGAVFNLPMSTVTIVEDALMIAMSGAMLTMLV